MALVKIKVQVCDRCPVGREGPATRVEIISLGTSRFQLELCEDCGSRLDREFYAWARLGQQLETEVGPSFRGGYDVEQHRHTAELRHEQTQADRDTHAARLESDSPIIGYMGTGLPVSAGKWIFTKHAIERLSERNIRLIDALRAASQPKIQRPGRDTNVFIHVSNGIQVAVDRSTNRILTVAHSETEANDNTDRTISS